MSNFATDTLAKLQKQYDAMDDFGPGPLFAVIAELINEGHEAPASAVANTAALINMYSDPFIVEGETTNNQVFMEVMRRVFFYEDYDKLPTREDRDSYRRSVMQIATFLTEYGRRIQLTMVNERMQQGAANDERT